MILEVRYVKFDDSNNGAMKYHSVYISFPDRYVDNESVVNRICNKTWQNMALKVFDKKDYFRCYSAFTKDFKDFLMKKFGIVDMHPHNMFCGIKVFELPEAIPFLSK